MSELAETNPFQAPQDVRYVGSEDTEERLSAVAIRQEHLSHETSLKSVGTVFVLFSMFLGLAAFGYMVDPQGRISSRATGFLFAGAGLVMATGIALRLLSRWAWLPLVLVICIGLFTFRIGTLINLYVVYLIVCPKGRMVCSPAYHEIVRMTPEIRYRTSPVIIILVGFSLLALAAGVLFLLLSP